MAWPRPSLRWKRGARSSHLMCRQRVTRNRVAMRAACLVLMALGEGKMSLQFLEFLLCHNSIQYPYDSLSSFLHTDRFLGDAGFDLQIDNISRGSEDTVYGNGLFLKSRTAPISCKVCFLINQVVQRCLSSYFVLHNAGVSCTNLLAEYSIGYVNHTHFLFEMCCLKYHTTVRQPSSWQVCTFWDPFILMKRRSPLDALSSSTLSPLLASSNAPAESFSMLFRSIQSLFLRFQPFIRLV